MLLRLRDQDYPDARQIEDWPSWDLPILKWAKAQGAVTGFAHTGWGLQVASHELPNYEMPPFDGIGANEYIVDVTHDAVDFISALDTPYAHELNIWYHTLNCGFRTRLCGETDFPCITDERVGGGRSYVHLAGPLSYDAWCEGVRSGRCYVSDGFAPSDGFHRRQRRRRHGRTISACSRPGRVAVSANAACLLPEQPAPRPDPTRRPYWTPEHARIPGTRDVNVEAVVNGQAVARQRLTADGAIRALALRRPHRGEQLDCASHPGSAHTNPFFVHVAMRPIRASRQSARVVPRRRRSCWEQKGPRIRAREREAARLAYEHARARYRTILSES